MNDLFLDFVGVKTEEGAMRETLKSALGRNKVYAREEAGDERAEFRREWARLFREDSKRYTHPVSDLEHCESIRRVSDELSRRFGGFLINGRLRYGTSQKALNLYLKYLWRLGKTNTPPHCPIDSTVLAEGGVTGLWTKSDSEKQYMEWIDELKRRAKPRCLAEWEHEVWLRSASKQSI